MQKPQFAFVGRNSINSCTGPKELTSTTGSARKQICHSRRARARQRLLRRGFVGSIVAESDPVWTRAESPEHAFDEFVSKVNEGRYDGVSGDHAVALAACIQCAAVSSKVWRMPHVPGGPVAPAFKREVVQWLTASDGLYSGACSSCRTRMSMAQVSNCYYARETMMDRGIILVSLVRSDGAWAPAHCHAFVDGKTWIDLGDSPSSREEVEALGRPFHPVEAIHETIGGYQAGRPWGASLISPEECVAIGPAKEWKDAQAIASAAAATGLPGPYRIRGLDPKIVPNGIQASGSAATFSKNMRDRNAAIAFVFSETRLRNRLVQWGQMYQVTPTLDKKENVTFAKGGVQVKFALGDLVDQAMARCCTVNEAVFAAGLARFKPMEDLLSKASRALGI